MNNKIEILRSICYTENDLKTIKNLGNSFSKKEIEFMVEFKKIYELGIEQLQKFLDKMEDEGSELDTYSIMYYVSVLLNGPLGEITKGLLKEDSKYFGANPDILGNNGNISRTTQNIALYENSPFPMGCSADTYRKLPEFMISTLTDSIEVTEELFRSCVQSSTVVDNTLPIVDKDPQARYGAEYSGHWVLKANGSYMVKDSYNYYAIEDVSQQIFEKVKETLGDEDFRIYHDKKEYNPFDAVKNEATATNNKIEKEFIEGENTEIINLDLMGDVFDSEEKRESVLKVESPEKDEEFILNTNAGQLGN